MAPKGPKVTPDSFLKCGTMMAALLILLCESHVSQRKVCVSFYVYYLHLVTALPPTAIAMLL